MKLINADELKPTKGMFIYQTEDADVIATEAYRWELIEREAPTVKAIPVEWLLMARNKYNNHGLPKEANFINELIALWGICNETN